MTQTEPTEVEKKKGSKLEDKATTIGVSMLELLKVSGRQILYLILYFLSGIIVLFYSKLGRASVIPTNPNCMPDISECIINLFNTWDDNSMKMKFSDVL